MTTYNKSEIFASAHKLAKLAMQPKNFYSGQFASYKEALAFFLKQRYESIKKAATIEKQGDCAAFYFKNAASLQRARMTD